MGVIGSQESLHLDTKTPSGLPTKWLCFGFETGFLGWPGTGYAHQAGHKLKGLPASASSVLNCHTQLLTKVGYLFFKNCWGCLCFWE